MPDPMVFKGAINPPMAEKRVFALDQVFNELDDGFILVDKDIRLLIVNRAARTIFNIGQMQVEGKPVDEVFSNPDLLDIFKPYQSMPFRNEITTQEGKRIFSAQASEIPSIGLAVLLHDITHLKELDRIKTDFVNTVSHDLRSPLTAVYGFIGLIDRVGPINQQQAEFIHHIQSSLQNITSLINDLLDLGRLEASQDILMVKVHLGEVIGQVLNNLEYQSSEKLQEISVNIPDDLPQVLGNPLHLQRMIGNLVENAVKFTQLAGKIEIRCRTEANQVVLEVADNGPGIPLVDQPHVFEKFYRAGNLSDVTNGTGLGLSIVKSIVEKHRGRIWLDSSPRGTTFTVILPTD